MTVAVFDCSLSVIDQGGHMLIGEALDHNQECIQVGVSALGLHLGPIRPQQDARGWKQGPVSGQVGRSGFQCWPAALR